MDEIQNLVNSTPSDSTSSYNNFGTMPSTSHYNFGAAKKSNVNWTWVIMGTLLLVIVGLLIGLYFNKCECVCEVTEEENFGTKSISARPILNPLIGPRSARMPNEPRRGSQPVGSSTFPAKLSSLEQPYASPPFAMHN